MTRKLKKSEARILVYLSQAPLMNRFTRKIGSKLNIEYGYLLRILASMNEKMWIRRDRHDRRVFYHINKRAPIEQAKQDI